jgi:hypothetical protein
MVVISRNKKCGNLVLRHRAAGRGALIDGIGDRLQTLKEVTMRLVLLAAAASTALLSLPAAANAESLTVSTTVQSFCSIGLANVAGNTVAVANGLRQKVTTMRMACNYPKGAQLQATSANGDMKSAAGDIINYDWELVVQPPAASLGWAPSDTAPGGVGNKTTNAAYSSGLASGVLADLFLNLCYKTVGGNTPGTPQQDNASPGSSGCPFSANPSEALSAPSGTYTETFVFTLNGLS